jgi:hypothetical protein
MTAAQRLETARKKLAELEAAQGTDETVLSYVSATIGHLEATVALEKALQGAKPRPYAADLARLLLACARVARSVHFGIGDGQAHRLLIEAGGEPKAAVYLEKGTAIDSVDLTIDGINLYAQSPERAATEDELAARRARAESAGGQA